MKETIVTLPVTEVFEQRDGCPLCTLRDLLEERTLDVIMGAAMMEPDVRLQTNRKGFCEPHYRKMLGWNNRLALALMLETHLDEILQVAFPKKRPLIPPPYQKQAEKAKKIIGSCYVCDRIHHSYDRMLTTVVIQWGDHKAFRALFSEQPELCLPHWTELIEAGQKQLTKSTFPAFAEAATALAEKTARRLRADLADFSKLFDYRTDPEAASSKRVRLAPDRAIGFLTARKKG